MNSRFSLGIDAGGTYTDIAVLDMENGKVVVYAKAMTTRPDPSEGIRNALAKINKELLSNVSMVSLATTFATNAIVENKGAEAGLILIGYNETPSDIPVTTRVLRIDGGHTVTGEEKAPLDTASLKEHLDSFLQGLGAIAVTGFFSVRNSEHEHKVARMVKDAHDVSIVLGHQLSMRLDAMRRATTAWWNARLIPLIRNLIRATESVLEEMQILAPLMIVKGDGTLMSVDTSIDRPIDTILSGPAASILGARFLADTENALIVDMGGTTTDMALLVDGKVAINSEGAHVGKWKTHVEAARVRTIGLGGDSLISMDEEDRLNIGPRRVIPLCFLAERFPEVIDHLKMIIRQMKGYRRKGFNPCSFFIQATPTVSLLSEFLLFEDRERWSTILNIKQDEKNGETIRSALTPTDIRVASGKIHFGDREASKLGLAVFAKYAGMEEAAFQKAVEEEISRRLCLEAVCFVSGTDIESLHWVTRQWLHRSSHQHRRIDIDLQVSLTSLVIGAGAPAAAYLPVAFQKLNTECVLPEPYSVACAIGAVVGVVESHLTGEIRPTSSGKYSLHTLRGREVFDTVFQAVESGRLVLQAIAGEQMVKNHVADPLMVFSTEERKVKTRSGEEVYLETQLHLKASGRPNVWREYKKID